MSDKTDPRLESAKGWVAEDWERELREDDIPFPDDSLTERAVDMLTDLDDADRAAGIVRVDTNDEALVERLWDAVDDVVTSEIEMGTVSRQALVDSVLAALREAS